MRLYAHIARWVYRAPSSAANPIAGGAGPDAPATGWAPVLPVILVLLAGLGVIAADWRTRSLERDLRGELLANATAIARSIRPESVKALSFSAEDRDRVEFQRLNAYLRNFKPVLPISGIYTQAMRDGVILFGPESYAPGEQLSSQPGTPYEQPTEANWAVFQTGIPITQGPYTDEYGTFLTGFAPVLDPMTGQVLMVVGLDIEVRLLNAAVRRERWLAGAWVALLATLVTVSVLLLQWRARLPLRWQKRLRHLESWVAAALGSVLTLMLALAARETELNAHHMSFHHLAEAQSERIAEAFRDLQDNQLGELVRYYESSHEVNPEEFHRLTAPILRESGVQALEWLPRVSASATEAFENNWRAHYGSDFSIWQRGPEGRREPVTGRDFFYPVMLAAPEADNRPNIGFDRASDPAQRAALEEALSTGLPTGTDALAIAEDQPDPAGMAIFHPLSPFARPEGSAPDVIAAVIRFKSLLQSSLAVADQGLSPTLIRLYQLQAGSEPTRLATLASEADSDPAAGRWSISRKFPIFFSGNTYALTVEPGVAFIRANPVRTDWVVGLAGALITLFITVFTYMLSQRGASLEAEVRVRTAELQHKTAELERFFDLSVDLLCIAGFDGRFVKLNRAWESVLGYPLSEIEQRSFLDFVHPDDRQASLERLADSGDSMAVLEFNNRYRCQDGTYRQIEWRSHASGNLIYAAARDITERSLAESAIRRSQKLLSDLLQAASEVSIISTTPDGTIVVFNRGAERMLGYRAEELAGKCTPAVIHVEAEVRSRGAELSAELNYDVTGFEVFVAKPRLLGSEMREWTYVRKDGSTLMVSLVVTAIRSEEGEITGFLGIALDVTERKLMEDALRESEARWQFALEGAGDGLWDWDARTNSVYFSTQWKRMLGYEDDEIGSALEEWESRVHPDDLEAVHADLQAHFQCRSPVYVNEHRMRCKDGAYKWILDRGRVVERDSEGAPCRVIGTHTDISERKRLEQLAAEQRARLEAFVKHAPAAVAMFDRDVRFIAVSNQWIMDYGLQGMDIIGKSHYEVFPNIPERWREVHARCLQGAVERADQDIWQPDGRYHFLKWEVRPWYGSTGEVAGIMMATEDITNAVRLRMDLEEATAYANRLAAEAAMANMAKSEFLANMSHEIRTPMNGVIGMTDILLDTELTPDQRQYAEVVRSSAQALLDLINSILDFSKIEARKLELESIDFDLRITIEDAAEVLALSAHEKGLELLCRVEPEVPSLLRGDPGRLRQIILNLGGNAVKFTEAGEVSIHAFLQEETEHHVLLRIEVADTGIGVPAEKHGLLFSPFTQADASTTRTYGGTGLGLAICKQLAELMGGQIGLNSEPGQGSVFWITAVLDKQTEGRPRLVPGDVSGLRIAVIDAYSPTRSLISSYARQWGCPCLEASDHASTMALLESAANTNEPIDVVLVDMHLPWISAVALCHEIREHPCLQGTKLVAMTMLGRKGEAAEMEAVGFSGYLVKPIRETQLLGCLRLMAGQTGTAPEAGPTPIVTRHTVAETLKQQARILVVDDNATNRMVALKILEKLGYRAEAVNNGQEALDALTQGAFDLVFMDCQMPGMDGFQATRIIRDGGASSSNRSVPIVAMTAHAMTGDREACLEAGMSDYLAKPVRAGEVSELLGRWLKGGHGASR